MASFPGSALSVKLLLPITIALTTVVGNPQRAIAHGVIIESEPIQSLQMRALFESGDPMANAQVTIYSPADPQTPWQQLTTDENGYFVFTPDPAIIGDWDVQVRQAGHGDLVRVAIDGKSNSYPVAYAGGAVQQSGQSAVQKWVTIAAVMWGFVGTALFFAQRQPAPVADAKAPSPSGDAEAHPPNPGSNSQPTLNK